MSEGIHAALSTLREGLGSQQESPAPAASSGSAGEVVNAFSERIKGTTGAAYDGEKSYAGYMPDRSSAGRQIVDQWRTTNEGVEDQRTFVDRVSADLTAIANQSPEEVEDWKQVAQIIVRLREGGDPAMQEYANTVMGEFEEDLRPHVDLVAGADWWGKAYQGPSLLDKGKGALGKVVGLAMPVLEVLDAASQDVLESISTAGRDPVTGEEVSNSPFSGEMWSGVGRGLKNLIPGVDADSYEGNDQNDDGRINFREAIGEGYDDGGFLGDVVDFAVTVGLDPLTYVTFGTTRSMKSTVQGTVAVAAREGNEAAARRIWTEVGENGARNLAKADRDLLEGWVLKHSSAAAARQSTSLTASAARTVRQGIDRASGRYAKLTSKVDNLGASVADDTLNRFGSTLRKIDAGAEGGLRIAGNTVIKNPIPNGGILQSATANSTALQTLRNAFVPRANLADNAGSEAAGQFRQVVIEAEAAATKHTEDAVARLMGDGVYARAVAEVGGEETLQKNLNLILADGDNLAENIARTSGATRQLLDAVVDIRQQIWDAIPESAAKAAFDKDSYIPRYMTSETRSRLAQVMKDRPDLADEIAGFADAASISGGKDALGHADSFLARRGFAPEVQDLFEVNRQAAGWLRSVGITDLGDVFTTDVLAAYSARASSAFRARVLGDITEGLTKVIDDAGDALVMSSKERAASGVSKLKHKFVPEMGAYVHVDVVDELEDLFSAVRTQHGVEELSNVWQQANEVWARYALLSPGFHARNAVGNFFNMFLAGWRNPALIGEAVSIQDDLARVMRHMGDTAMSRADAMADLGINANRARLMDDLLDNRVIGGQVADVFKEADLGRFNVTAASRKAGEAIENNSRITLYLDQVRKGNSPRSAAETVREHLFDYSDLTRFERGVRRNVSRFYTFLRKNLELQVGTLIHTPGKVLNAQRISETFTDAIFGDGEGQGGIPLWAQAAGMQWRGDNVVGIDTPFTAATQNFESITAIAAIPLMTFGLDEQMPDELRDALFYGDRSDAFGRAFGLFSGLGPALVDYAYAEVTGVDPFTKGELSDDPWDERLRMLSVFNPAVDRVDRLAEDFGLAADGEGKVEDRFLMAMNWLGGFNVYEGERAENAARYTLMADLDQMIEGQDLISVDDLRDLGRIDFVSRVDRALAYGDPGELEDDLKDILGADLMDALGITRNIDPTSSDPQEREKALLAVREKVDALELYYGRALTEDEIALVVVTSPWAPGNAELEQLGLEPYRTSNRFDSEEKLSRTVDANMDRVAALINAAGGNADLLNSVRPRQTDTARAFLEGAAAGMTEAEVVAYLVDELSRTEQAVLFGPDTLDVYGDMSRDARDEYNEQVRGWETADLVSTIYRFYMGSTPSIDQVEQIVAMINMNKGDQSNLVDAGLLDQTRPTVPNRKNTQTEAEQVRDSFTEFDSILRGVREGAPVGAPPERSDD